MDEILISVKDIVVSEADSTGIFVVTLNRPSNQVVTIRYDTYSQTAGGSDFVDIGGTLSFAPGETTKTIAVPIINDTTVESNETLGLALSLPTNGVIAKDLAVATIIDNDTIGSPNISVSNLVVDEKDGQAFVSIVLDKASASNVAVNYTTQNGTATAGSDYQSVNGTVTFTPGQTAKTIPVILIDDSQNEMVESFNFILSNGTNATIGQAQAGVLIGVSDIPTTGEPSLISVKDIVVSEADSTGIFVVTLNRPSNQVVSVRYDTYSQTA
jgi:uncharacterized protein YcfL